MVLVFTEFVSVQSVQSVHSLGARIVFTDLRNLYTSRASGTPPQFKMYTLYTLYTVKKYVKIMSGVHLHNL